jgi:hypothetical protein
MFGVRALNYEMLTREPLEMRTTSRPRHQVPRGSSRLNNRRSVPQMASYGAVCSVHSWCASPVSFPFTVALMKVERHVLSKSLVHRSSGPTQTAQELGPRMQGHRIPAGLIAAALEEALPRQCAGKATEFAEATNLLMG